jgi:DNA topoisomerase-2
VVDIAGCNPSVKIFFCGSEIKCKSFEDYVRWYRQDYYYEKSTDGLWSVAVAPSSEGFSQVSFVNGSDTYDGGSHVDYITSGIIQPLRDYFMKKFKVDVKPSEIKNHFQIFLSSTIVNPSFSSQTKEKLITEPKDWGYTFTISPKMIGWILRSEIVKSISDWIIQKKAADQNKMQRQLNKQVDNLKVEKLVDAKAKDRWRCSLGIFEGDSASNSFRKYRDPQTQGSFSLKGKFINVSDLALQKMTDNKELVNLMSAIGLKLGQKATLKTLRWGRIIFYADQDPDGNSIVALLLNFFYKFWPELFDMNFVFKAETPLMVVKSSKLTEDLWFYSMQEFDKWSGGKSLKDYTITYKKGLGALEDDEYKKIIKTPNLVKISSDELSTKKLDIWFGKNSALRKEELFDVV